MKTRYSKRKRVLGFTLLEVLVSISVFSMVAIISYTTLDTYIEQRERLSGFYGKLERVQRLFIMMERDIQFMTRRKVRVRGDLQGALLSNDGDALMTMTVAEPDFRGVSGVVLKRVQWQLDGRELIRSEWTVLDQADQQDPVERVTSDEIEDIEINYLLYQPGQELESTAELRNGQYPDGVEVIITLAEGETYRRVFGTAIGGGVVP